MVSKMTDHRPSRKLDKVSRPRLRPMITISDLFVLLTLTGCAIVVWEFYAVSIAAIIGFVGAILSVLDVLPVIQRGASLVTFRVYSAVIVSSFSLALSFVVCAILILSSRIGLTDSLGILRSFSLAGVVVGAGFPATSLRIRRLNAFIYFLFVH